MINVKICGLKTLDDVKFCNQAGARYIGLNFYEKSPRFVNHEHARLLALGADVGVMKVGLFVDADDEFLDETLDAVPLDMIQLHGKESPARLAQVRARFGLPIMKAIGISEEADLEQLAHYYAADQFLLDAKPPKGAVLPGGNGIPFDWNILKNAKIEKPWMLAGGLTASNVAQAIKLSGALQVDVSSGVESAPGIKDNARIHDFIIAARGLSQS